MHLLQADVRDLRGHAEVSTTEIYARTENTKRAAIENAYQSLPPGPSQTGPLTKTSSNGLTEPPHDRSTLCGGKRLPRTRQQRKHPRRPYNPAVHKCPCRWTAPGPTA